MAIGDWKQQGRQVFNSLKKTVNALLPRSSNQLVGLDIGSDSLKLLKIDCNATPYKVENFSTISLPSGAIVKDEIKDTAAVASSLRDAFKLSGIRTKQVALAIPRSIALIKNITIDSRLKSDEIESRAWIEANRNFPDLVGDIYLDFVVARSSAQDSTQLELILVACRKDQIQPYIETLRLAGLQAKILDVNCYALERALPMMPEASVETIALLNLNSTLSTLIVVHKGELIYAHDQTYDGNRLLTQTREYLKTKEVASLEDMDYSNILKENLTSHLRHTMHFFYSSRPHINVQKLILSGDCAVIPNLNLFIQRETGIETVIADPFKSMEIDTPIKEKELKLYAPTLMLCCGLALSNLRMQNK